MCHKTSILSLPRSSYIFKFCYVFIYKLYLDTYYYNYVYKCGKTTYLERTEGVLIITWKWNWLLLHTSRLTLSFFSPYLRVEWAHHMSGHKRRFLVSMLTQWRSHNRPTHTIPAYTQNALQPLFRFLIQDLCCRFFNALQAWVAIFQRSPSISTCNWYWSTIPTIKPRFGYNYILYFLYYEAINIKLVMRDWILCWFLINDMEHMQHLCF